MTIFLPDLVLDTIFCHVIDGQTAVSYPQHWHECLMTVPYSHLPQFGRNVLRQLVRVDGTNLNAVLSASLLSAWAAVMSPLKAQLVPNLLRIAVTENLVDVVDWFCVYCNQKYQRFLAVTADLVDTVSAAGAPMLDRVWQLHCRDLKLLPAAFPYSVQAVDNALNVATLDWWWTKHKEHSLDFKYTATVHRYKNSRSGHQAGLGTRVGLVYLVP
ncbi:hypothetical protein BC828DRAFT_163652 [Blastocladiella britannica]|nr:hypothetical protein BC828DRAFT_163652 [Blastocladiella britannica]